MAAVEVLGRAVACSMGEVKIEWEVQSKTYERKKLCEGLEEELGWISGHLCYAPHSICCSAGCTVLFPNSFSLSHCFPISSHFSCKDHLLAYCYYCQLILFLPTKFRMR